MNNIIENHSRLFRLWLEKHNNANNSNVKNKPVGNFQEWLQKQVSVARPNLSPVNWGDYKTDMIKPKDFLNPSMGGSKNPFSSSGFTLPPLRRDKLNERNFKLIPQRTMVRRVGKMPYFATRWKRVEAKESGGFIIIPVDDYEGDIDALYETWRNHIQSTSDNEGDDKMLIPLIALQEIIYKEHDGILMQRDKRIVGVVSLDVDENEEVNISLLSASPLDIQEGEDIEEEIEDALLAGIRQYIRYKGYSADDELFDDNEEEGEGRRWMKEKDDGYRRRRRKRE